MFRGLFLYYDRETWLHRAHPASKLVMVLAISSVALAAMRMSQVLYIFVLLVALLLSLRPPRSRLIPIAKLVLALILVTTISQAVFYYEYYVRGAGTVLLVIVPRDVPIVRELTMGRGIVVTLEGFAYGLLISLKLLAVIVVSQLLLFTTSLTEMISLARRLGAPSKLIFLVLSALRLVPVALEELSRLSVVLRMKSSRRSTLLHPLLAVKCLVRELVVRAAMLAVTLEIRCPRLLFPNVERRYSTRATLVVFVVSALASVAVFL